MTCDVRIGTSGFHYKHWKGPFYPEKTPTAKMLDFYIQHFDTVELNNSFYRLPPATAFDYWRDSKQTQSSPAWQSGDELNHWGRFGLQ